METFRQYLTEQVAQYVQLHRGGPEACQGWVLHVGRDYLTLCCPDDTRLHLPLHHLRSVTPLPQDAPPPPAPAEPWPETYGELLAGHIGQVVRLNHGGPELTVGTLVDATADYVLLELAPDSRVCYARFHLRSLSQELKIEG